ncbi:MAG: 50S ribosomal protein L28 [Candidatus Omnitrophica bacterium]|nr:50S ribosomal protein L28 [Candidatus Omnitrophota bacterium]
MLKICALCKKGELKGKSITRKGLIKSKGGTGSKISRWTKRRFLPNLQAMRILINGHPKRVYLCAKCIKKGEFQKA